MLPRIAQEWGQKHSKKRLQLPYHLGLFNNLNPCSYTCTLIWSNFAGATEFLCFTPPGDTRVFTGVLTEDVLGKKAAHMCDLVRCSDSRSLREDRCYLEIAGLLKTTHLPPQYPPPSTPFDVSLLLNDTESASAISVPRFENHIRTSFNQLQS